MAEVAKILSVAPIGFEGSVVEVEGDAKAGLPSIQIVGLGNKAIDEARERVRSAITNSLLEFPAKKIIINLAPAELPKDGTLYDLPIALAILVASGQLRASDVTDAIFAGELALNGDIRPITGAISVAETAKQHGVSTIYLPTFNTEQASLVEGISIIGISSLKELFLHLKKEIAIQPYDHRPQTSSLERSPDRSTSTLDDIHGQEQAKRAITIAAAGHHNILLAGPPGAGKTMLAQALLSLLPPLSRDEQVAVTKLYSLAGETTSEIISARPFRSPHHTASRVALIGGGNKPKPGEISLAHLGVLFLDEIPEYPRSTIEALRQPLEDHKISVSRAGGKATYPATFMLVATMNPCPCGYFGDSTKECTCTQQQILSYQQRLSGPLLDRIDLIINVSRVKNDELLNYQTSSHTQHNEAVLQINRAINFQNNRYNSSSKYNNSLTSHFIKTHITLSPDVRNILTQALDRLNLSARSYFKIIKVARTIADLEGLSEIQPHHVAEALQYRQSTS